METAIWLVGLLVALLSGNYTESTSSPTALERMERDEIVLVEDSDPEMAAAIRKARASLPEFFRKLHAPERDQSDFALKVAVNDDENTEYFWITDIREEAGQFSGQIDNVPRLVKNVTEGQIIRFTEERIIDWLYVEGRTMKGNYTICPLLKRRPKNEAEEAKALFGLACDP